MWIIRVLSSVVFLTSTILSVPLAFDVGGRTCGLAFSFSLATFYFFYSTLKLITPEKSNFRRSLVYAIGFAQWIILPTLLIWSLNRFSVDADNTGGSWVERTFGGKRAQDKSLQEWVFGRSGLLESMTIGSWDTTLRWSTPVFQLCEGFCSLLVIQAAGQITRWAVNRSSKSDTWMVSFGHPPAWSQLTCQRLSSLLCLRQSFQVRCTSSGVLRIFPRSATWMRF